MVKVTSPKWAAVLEISRIIYWCYLPHIRGYRIELLSNIFGKHDFGRSKEGVSRLNRPNGRGLDLNLNRDHNCGN